LTPKAAGLVYGLEDRPPLGSLLLISFQHLLLMSSTLALPAALMAEIGGSVIDGRGVLALTMIAAGLGTILQACRLPGVGSGYLCPNLCGPNFFLASANAAWLGGLPLMRGMTIAAGLFEFLFAGFIRRLQPLFPTAVLGVVVLMVGVGLVPIGASRFMSIAYAGDPVSGGRVAVAAITVLTMVAVNLFSKGTAKLFTVLIGMVVGYLLAWIFGYLVPDTDAMVAAVPWFGLPAINTFFSLEFRWDLLPVWIIVSICGALKSFGNLVLCQKYNDDQWTETDIAGVRRGLMADALSLTTSGLLGGMATDTSSSNVAFSGASGATSRVVAYVAGGAFMLLGLSPKISTVLTLMPSPVAGALLLFVTAYMMMSGVQIISRERLDSGRLLCLGLAVWAGLSVDIIPSVYADVPSWIRPLFASSLTIATVVAVVLFQWLRLADWRHGGR